jgi:glycosyltransferase 2 family protein
MGCAVLVLLHSAALTMPLHPVNLVQIARRPWFRWGVRALVLLAVGWGVSHTLQKGIDELARHEWHLQSRWLVAAGLLYLAGLVPMAWFWRRALAACGLRPSWPVTLRAYFLGHLGKYVPGKVLVIVLRVGTLGRAATSLRPAVVCTVLETLTMMSVGACLAALLATFALHLDAKLTVLAAAMAVVAVLPTLPPIARRLAGSAASQSSLANASSDSTANGELALTGITARLLATGWLAAIVCWTLLGTSLWATLRSIGVAVPLVDELTLMMAAASLAVVAGFLSMLPGGIGVRDALLMQLLAPLCGDANALIAAVLVRLVWLMSELAACGILYIAARSEE